MQRKLPPEDGQAVKEAAVADTNVDQGRTQLGSTRHGCRSQTMAFDEAESDLTTDYGICTPGTVHCSQRPRVQSRAGRMTGPRMKGPAWMCPWPLSTASKAKMKVRCASSPWRRGEEEKGKEEGKEADGKVRKEQAVVIFKDDIELAEKLESKTEGNEKVKVKVKGMTGLRERPLNSGGRAVEVVASLSLEMVVVGLCSSWLAWPDVDAAWISALQCARRKPGEEHTSIFIFGSAQFTAVSKQS